MKARFDYGYCYEYLTISHLTDLIGEENFKVRPNVMYYVKKIRKRKFKFGSFYNIKL